MPTSIRHSLNPIHIHIPVLVEGGGASGSEGGAEQGARRRLWEVPESVLVSSGEREPVFRKLCVYRWCLSPPPGDGVASLLGGGVASFVRTQGRQSHPKTKTAVNG
jgi:hypothetical protein